MDDTTGTGPTAQSGRIIELTNSVRPMYWCSQIGRDFGSPAGGWTEERAKATVLEQDVAEEMLRTSLLMLAPYCLVVLP